MKLCHFGHIGHFVISTTQHKIFDQIVLNALLEAGGVAIN